MKKKTLWFCMICLAVCLGGLEADNLIIGQIDSSALLLSQQVNLYLSVTDERGKPVRGLTADQFTVSESITAEENFTQLSITDFRADANKLAGIHFLLLIDNSGSMYNTLSSRKTDDVAQMRISHARNALKDFLGSMTGTRDTVGLAYFNTHYVQLVTQTKQLTDIEAALGNIERPSSEQNEDYTELYAALTLATDKLSNLAGRKVIIVLSDGKNEAFFTGTGLPHPRFNDKLYEHTEPVRKYQEEGISCFAIDFGGAGDKMLDTVALETGGRVFRASSQQELSGVYQEIKERILGEYRLSYRAGMIPADKKYVRVNLTPRTGESKAVTRFYFSSTIFGIPLDSPGWLFIIPVILALLLWLLLTRIKFIKLNKQPNLEVISAGPGTVLTQVVPLDNNVTVIGGSEKANLTIAGVPSIKDSHATIVYDEKQACFTLISDQEVAVNNNFVKRKKLEAGDVINVEGTTIVFDDDTFSK